MNLLIALLIIFLIQMVFFVFAAIKKTDKVTDLAYGMTFACMSAAIIVQTRNYNLTHLLAALLVIIWGVRLSGYLFYRIQAIKTDKRFDGIREDVFKFAQFWTLQIIAIWIILLPFLIITQDNNVKFNSISIIGFLLSVIGILIESIADIQKFRFKNKKENIDKWANIGLWKISRHPNYLGEIIMWVGLYAFSLPYLKGIEHLAILSPIFITFLLLFVSGIPTIEKKYDKKYKDNDEYQLYKRKTGILLPKF